MSARGTLVMIVRGIAKAGGGIVGGGYNGIGTSSYDSINRVNE